jgi:hypothetical protein
LIKPMKKIPESVYTKIADELSPLEGAARSLRVAELAHYYGASVKTINRIARIYGLRVRRTRRDAGVTVCPADIIDKVASRLLIGKSLNKKFTNPIKNAMRMVEAEGVEIPVGYAEMCRLLKAKDYSKEDLAAQRTTRVMLSKYPNHVWQFDVSNCLQWHLKHKTGMYDMWDWELKFYKNKGIEQAKKYKRVLRRYVAIDHCSGAFYFEYFYAPGERAEDGAEFFFNAFSSKAPLLENSLGLMQSDYQLNGVPEMLVSDKGSILRSAPMANLMRNLGVEVNLHAAGAPWAKGMVEGTMNIIGTGFEPILKYKRPKSLEELNAWALAWCVERNCETQFRGAAEPRQSLWFKGIAGHLRNCPPYDIYTSLQHYDEETREVDGSGHLSYRGIKYYVHHPDAPLRTATVLLNAYDYPKIIVKCLWDGTVVDGTPTERDEYNRLVTPANVTFGEYKGIADNKRVTARKHLEKVAGETTGVEWKGNESKRQAVAPSSPDTPLPGFIAQAMQAAESDIPRIPIAGEDITPADIYKPAVRELPIDIIRITPKPQAERYIPVDDILRQYREEVGRVTPALRQAAESKYPLGVPARLTLNEVIDTITGGSEDAYA